MVDGGKHIVEATWDDVSGILQLVCWCLPVLSNFFRLEEFKRAGEAICCIGCQIWIISA